MAKIQLNGKKVSIRQKLSISDLLRKHKLDTSKIAVEINGVIIDKAKYKKKILKNNDRIEVVHFIGGG